MSGVALLAALAAVGWYWSDSLSALEVARRAGRRVCDEQGLQFLDDTVARTALTLVRDERGRRVLSRRYRFEFSETGDNRREGWLVLLGDRVVSVTLEPYRLVE